MAPRRDAREFAAHVIRRERLKPEERAKLKQQQAEGFREQFMARQEPTEKQLNYLKRLGSTETPTDRATASKMIDELLKDKSSNRAA